MKGTMRVSSILIMSCGVLSLLILQGCSLLERSNPLEPTLTALSASINLTVTAIQQEDTTTNVQATSESIATAQSLLLSTQTAQSIAQDQQAEQTASAIAPILAELPVYGLDPSSGQAGWLHPPLTLEMNAYHDYKYGNDFMNVPAADFVLASDINWDTQYGGSGCGFMFRSNGNANSPDQYMVMATRFASGHVVFMALNDGKISNFHDFYPRTEDRSFSADNGATNRLAVVARGNLIDIYTNGVKIGEVDTTQAPQRPSLPAAPKPPENKLDIPALDAYQKQIKEYTEQTGLLNTNYQAALANYQGDQAVYSDGFLAMVALSESGQTICNFKDAWLWHLNK